MSFEIEEPLPYCSGCGHQLIVKGTAKAFEKLDWEPKDVILITDIGCVGLADKYFPCHTVHGLHGRAVALGTGIRFGLNNSNKHVVVYQGDGGATIGLQHLLEGARLNIDIKVVIHNNMLYGMTGGQSSGLTPSGYKTTTEPEGSTSGSYDLPKLVHQAGASFCSRILGQGNIVDHLAEGLAHPGFSLIEVMEYCISYGQKYNPGEKLKDILEKMGRDTGKWVNEKAYQYQPKLRGDKRSLLDKIPIIKRNYTNNLSKPLSILLGGSAGEGIQTAATVLSQAGMLAGLEASKKGEYPITVRSGFSVAEIILSPNQILFTGLVYPDVAIITSKESFTKNKQRIESMKGGTLLIDESLPTPTAKAEIFSKPFRKKAGAKGAALCAVAFWVDQAKVIPWEALLKAAETSKHSEALKVAIQSATEL